MKAQRTVITEELAAEHGLSAQEYRRIPEILGRTPTLTELGIFSAMWSEHCSYKSSRRWLRTLPSEAPHVIQGPGENAGVVDIGDGLAAVFKIESHNHPSFIEPRQGAATGVGGIMRDVFTMGARPIANLNALRFGDPDHPRTRHLVSGVVSGIGGYGNCVGVPTVAGEVNFHPAYNGNILVNAMTVGLAGTDRIFRSAAHGPGNPVIYVGARTGRDGIHGATMASAEFSEEAEARRPTVQVGDPFVEKLLLEACLELMAEDAIIAIQDMGAAGLTSSSVEMAGKGGLGMELDLDAVPVREEAMTAYELMLSESQERMLMVIRPEAERTAREIFRRWELDFAVIGRLTTNGRLTVSRNGRVEADIPIDPMVDRGPEYDRPWTATPMPDPLDPHAVPAPASTRQALETLIASPDLASRRWIWEQYDWMVMNDTLEKPGGDAAVVRVRDTTRALVLTVDCTPRYCAAHPETGGAQAVAEAWRNITATGARPLALTNNLNFGNPERPEIMGQLVGCIAGMRRAAGELGFPVVSGNVSLYNETDGEAILPTPVIGGVGLLDDISRRAALRIASAGEALVMVGETTGWLGQSLYLREVFGREEGAPPPVDLASERANGDLVRVLIADGLVTACHDLSDGGLAVAIAEMLIASDGIGAELGNGTGLPLHSFLFGEDQGRYLLATPGPGEVLVRARSARVSAAVIGRTTDDGMLTPDSDGPIPVDVLRSLHEAWLPRYMQGG